MTMVNEKTILKEWTALLKELKKHIRDDYRVEGQDDETPTMQVTFGLRPTEDGGEWSYQTGDNSFTGGAYGYDVWGVCYITRRSNSKSVASDALDEAMNQIGDME